MDCAFCGCQDFTKKSVVYTADMEEVTVVLKDVPAHICTRCSEIIYDKATTQNIIEIKQKLAAKQELTQPSMIVEYQMTANC